MGNFYARANQHGGIHLLNKKDSGIDQRGRQSKTTVPDAVILEIRTRHEIERLTTNQIYAAYPEYSKHYLRQIMEYTLRAKLTVK